ncbi:hypothetical protein MBM09_09005 [Flaviramulus sp. BrNp1-15]|uniref:hypothetical protein n=1 Tax=Flaviramulus sp. BrNp1-15 TaxID=2916754 RepID=UPI001EE98CEE|nr:hypothetical protein [Flaviramulus sp. BrNp1-15]ULC58058.1 hypothetical protein MBM09_09005 [Flaviramulus sp. BrNp1-15]
MKKLNQQLILLMLLAFFSFSFSAISQVGIGTTTPDASSVLDVNSTTQGVLTPRMTTAQRTAIATPANGLLVYDTTENSFYFYKSSAWTKIDSKVRNNHKLIKSAADLSAELTAGGGTRYLLSANTLYEINGTITLAQPIELNNAYLIGLDTNEDILVRAGGTMFTGNTGGSIRNLTLTAPGGTIFNLTGTTGQNLIFRDSVVANSGSVGAIGGFGLVFISIVQFSGNTNGVTYNNITDLLLSNVGWLSSNTGTYETFTGTFSILEKQGGFSEVDGTAIGIDVSANPVVGHGVLTGTSFSGTSTQYINRYTVGSYTGYNFNNAWTVNCPGIPLESDQVATGNIYYNGTITTGFVQTVTNNTALNLSGNTGSNTTTAVNLFRISSPQNNRITYLGKKTKTFQINAALSIRGNSGTGDYYGFFIRKNGTTTLTETNTLMRVNNTSDISSNSISGTVELAPNDYIEIWGQRLVGSGTTSITVFSLNISIK